jgi:hypothetical protein
VGPRRQWEKDGECEAEMTRNVWIGSTLLALLVALGIG